ncbi:MAG: hypothetical protein JWP27_10 [Flaviaesturariibacter sp.]|nr:hypothetical protein [Flaviaesturariibacter sp.]
MKKIILTACFNLLLVAVAHSQTVNDIPIKNIDVDYVQIVGTSRVLSNKLTIEIDFGQENKLFSSDKDTRIKDVNGKNMIFNSMIDALNFMTKNGYDFVQAYAITVNNQNVYHYMLRKKKSV